MRSSPNAGPGEATPPLDSTVEAPGYFAIGAGAPVVMLHASLSSKSQWVPLGERLAPRFRAIALDLSGYGDNALPAAEERFTVDDEIDLVTARLDALVESQVRVHLVGHSYGGLVALRFAQRNPDRIASLVLFEPVVFRALDARDATAVDMRRRAAQVGRLVAGGDRREAARMFVDFWSGEGSYASQPQPIQAGIARRVAKVPLDFQAAFSWPAQPAELGAILTPTLLLAGRRSPETVQRIVTFLTRALPCCRVEWFDTGHLGPIVDAQRINPWIEAFVDLADEASSGFVRPPAGRDLSAWSAAAD